MPKLDGNADNARQRVMTFLEFVYESQAETLPDYRDDPKAVGLSVEVSHSYDAETAGQYKDAYVDVLMVSTRWTVLHLQVTCKHI